MIEAQEELVEQRLLISNYMVCHCGAASPVSPHWWKVQDWWRTHGFGRRCP